MAVASERTSYPRVSIKKGREWQILRGHPWLFSGGISQAPKAVSAGDVVDLVDSSGNFVARGYFNPDCDIAVRVLTLDANELIDSAMLRARVEAAWQHRKSSIDLDSTNAFRLINAEGDFLPGFIVDKYAGTLVVQSHTSGSDALLKAFLEQLDQVVQPECIVVRNDATARRREGLKLEPPLVVKGNQAESPISILENGMNFAVDVLHGQKTGFFADQRDKRFALAKFCSLQAGSPKMLNCFSYSGAFSVYAAKANCSVRTVNVDESKKALELARSNFELNGIPLDQHQFIEADAFQWLDSDATTFDIVIIDPPAFAKTHKDKQRALKGYTRVYSQGVRRCKSGALLVVCSCSGAISMEEFISCVKEAAGSSQRQIQVMETFQHGADHPINAAAPETGYLKVAFCRVG